MFPERSSKALYPACEEVAIWHLTALVLFVGYYFTEFDLNIFGFKGLATESGESVSSILETTTLDEVTRRIGKEQKTTTKDKTPSKLDANWDSVRSSVISAFSSITDTRCEENTDSDTKLISSDQSSSDLFGANFRP